MLPSKPSASLPALTITSDAAHPRVGETGVRTVTDVDVTDSIAAGLPLPKSTSVTPARLDPDTVTVVPPAAGPEDAEIAVTTGQVLGGGARSRPTSALATGVPEPGGQVVARRGRVVRARRGVRGVARGRAERLVVPRR